MRRLQSALLVSARNDSSAAARSGTRSERNVSLGADAIREAVRRLQGLLSRLEFQDKKKRPFSVKKISRQLILYRKRAMYK